MTYLKCRKIHGHRRKLSLEDELQRKKTVQSMSEHMRLDLKA